MIGVDARKFAAGFDFDVRGLGGRKRKVLESLEELGFGVGQDLVELEGGESRVRRELGTEKITGVDGQRG